MPGRRATAMDYEAMTTTMEADPLEDSQIDRARLTVVQQAIRENPDDTEAATEAARQYMMQLGIHPSQDGETGPLLAPNVLSNSN